MSKTVSSLPNLKALKFWFEVSEVLPAETRTNDNKKNFLSDEIITAADGEMC